MRFIRDQRAPRADWYSKVSETGMSYAISEGQTYWNEAACYHLDSKLVDMIEEATNDLHAMCMEMIGQIITQGDISHFYPYLVDAEIDMITSSWMNSHRYLYGRFDFGMDRYYQLKAYEYNADTPTSLLEASIVQWNWKEEVLPHQDQFNSIHEKLIDLWKNSFGYAGRVHFAAMREAPAEDWATIHYLADTAIQAGLQATSIDLDAIGWSAPNFVDMNNEPINTLFKLYPWEWLTKDEFGANIMQSSTFFIEPPWKMLLSTKALMAALWQYYPECPLLLPTFLGNVTTEYDKSYNQARFMMKPIHGREGQGIKEIERPWTFGEHTGDFVFQEKFTTPTFASRTPVIGSWVIGDQSAGIGIRESTTEITTNMSQFVPHVF